MREKIQSLLKELWAKDDGTTIREHTDKLLENLQKLRDYYRKEIEELIPKGLPAELRERFWEILELACEYHDYGKIHCKFQEKIGNKNIKPIKGLPEVRHNLLSPVFVNVEDELIRKIVRLLVLHHHPVEVEEVSVESVEKVLKEEWMKYGISKETNWRKLGLSPIETNSFIKAGFGFNEAKKWVDAGWTSGELAKRWYNAGFRPEESYVFEKLGLSPKQAGQIKNIGLTAYDLKPLIGAEIELIEEFINFIEEGGKTLSFEPLRKLVKELSLWRKEGFTIKEAYEWIRYGFSSQEAKIWKIAGFDPQNAIRWRKLGFNTEEAKEWIKSL